MMKLLLLIFLLPSHLFIFGVLSTTTLTIENKCDQTVWPVIFSWEAEITTTGFALQRGEAREIPAPNSWYGLISGRTLCSTAAGNFSCATGDCESGRIECPNRSYGWAPATYAYFRLDIAGFDFYSVNVEHGYNLPIVVVPSQKSNGTCIAAGCAVDNLNMTCPQDLKIFQEDKLVACNSTCRKSNTPEICCTRDYRSKETCKLTSYTSNFESACPRAYAYAYHEHITTFTCPSSTDYIITFCPSSFFPNNNTISNNRSSMPPPAPLTEKKHDSQRTLKIILGVSTALAVMIIIVLLAVIVRGKSTIGNSHGNDDNIEGAVMLKRYSYENVEKMTNSFDHVLGKGGFGTVYKGKLPDASGRDIALKILKESKGNGEEFINELASMSRASHVNIVSLFGFCYEGDNRAIIYEFMPNGSLDKFISENMSTEMDWKMLYNIAVGVARGLEYLHNSCVSKIVHFDIKPQNILMDKDFCPKISDFGLAKLCKGNDSVISLLDARGTIGYIAPEVYSKNFGGVSHKSDVYSYGMVVLEMIGARNVKRGENSKSNFSSMYFQDWVYEDLERKESMQLYGDHIIEEEEKIMKKMAFVGLWCIQTNPSDRPSMRKVVEMLEGSLEALQVPPKPLLTLHATTAWEIVEDSQTNSTNHLERTTC